MPILGSDIFRKKKKKEKEKFVGKMPEVNKDPGTKEDDEK